MVMMENRNAMSIKMANIRHGCCVVDSQVVSFYSDDDGQIPSPDSWYNLCLFECIIDDEQGRST